MPIGPVGQPPINRVDDVPAVKDAPQAESFRSQTSVSQPAPPAAASSPAAIAAQLILDARAAKSTGSEPSAGPQLDGLVKAVSADLGQDVPAAAQPSIAAKLADDPVVKTLIGQ